MKCSVRQWIIGMALCSVVLATHAQSEHAGHGGHTAPAAPEEGSDAGYYMMEPAPATTNTTTKDEHAGHAMPSVVSSDTWSYIGRDNPKPSTDARWEMWPVPEYGHMFINAQGQDTNLRCRALAAPGLMVDRATREACGLGQQPGSHQ